jgi:hypothetical protein
LHWIQYQWEVCLSCRLWYLTFEFYVDANVEFEWNRIAAIIHGIREISILRRSEIVIGIESNLSWTMASSLVGRFNETRFTSRYGPFKFLSTDEKQDGRAGIFMTATDKERYYQETNRYLRQGKISLHEKLVKTDLDIEDTLSTQMMYYRLIPKSSRSNEVIPVKFVPSGKRGKRKDDLVITFQMCIYWRRMFMRYSNAVR